ncbi:MAG: sugar phosphate nucleotidyltransferase [Rickettsiales bacterium]
MVCAVILAGGFGIRLREVVASTPKPMALIADRPFLELQMDYLIEQGVDEFILALGYKSEVIKNHFGNSYRNIPITYSTEKEPLGTGGALLFATQNIVGEQPFLALNGDSFFDVDLSELYKKHNDNNSDFTFALMRSNENGRYMGVETDSSDRVKSLNHPARNIGDTANAGIYLINPQTLIHFENRIHTKISLEEEIVPYLLANEYNVFGVSFDNEFIDIGTPKDYYRAQSIIPVPMSVSV